MLDANSLTQSPFAALTFVAATALLTNASSVLARGTINRMLRTRGRMHELFDESKAGGQTDEGRRHLTEVTDRVERQAALLLMALHAIYPKPMRPSTSGVPGMDISDQTFAGKSMAIGSKVGTRIRPGYEPMFSFCCRIEMAERSL
jgi:hypothetical protein